MATIRPDNFIFNPETGKFVKKTGRVAQKILKEKPGLRFIPSGSNNSDRPILRGLPTFNFSGTKRIGSAIPIMTRQPTQTRKKQNNNYAKKKYPCIYNQLVLF